MQGCTTHKKAALYSFMQPYSPPFIHLIMHSFPRHIDAFLPLSACLFSVVCYNTLCSAKKQAPAAIFRSEGRRPWRHPWQRPFCSVLLYQTSIPCPNVSIAFPPISAAKLRMYGSEYFPVPSDISSKLMAPSRSFFQFSILPATVGISWVS